MAHTESIVPGRKGFQPVDPIRRFWMVVAKSDGCWLWQGAIDSSGYGQLYVNGRSVLAHRLSWAIHYGEPQGHVLHECDTPACVNPAHLFLGDHTTNMADKAAKGRGKGKGHKFKVGHRWYPPKSKGPVRPA